LKSRDKAALSAFVTAKDAADARSRVLPIQTTRVNRGEGTFTLILPVRHGGWPHVSFYPAGGGNGFGGIYFGTGDTVLKRWWDSDDVADQPETGPRHRTDSPPLDRLRIETLAQDPATANLKQQLARYQMQLAQLAQLAESGRSDRSQAKERLERQIEQIQSQIALYERALERQLMSEREKGWRDRQGGSVEGGAAPRGKFPPLEQQKLADFIWRQLQLELEPIGQQFLQRVQALGYDGGVLVKRGRGELGGPSEYGQIQVGDILVGLHVWPTRNLQDVVDVLNRDDLDEYNPPKFYVVRAEIVGGTPSDPIFGDVVHTGRISVTLPRGRFQREGFGMMGGARGMMAAPPTSAPTSNAEMGLEEAKSSPMPRPADSDKSALRYDGKTFDEWRDLWKNELSTEKRLEAVKALAAFARAGYGKEATEAILNVASEYDFFIIQSDAEGKLKQAIFEALAPAQRPHSLVNYWLPDFAERLQKDPQRWKWLAAHMLGRVNTQDERLIEILRTVAKTGPEEARFSALQALVRNQFDKNRQLDEETRELIAERLKSDDPQEVRLALSSLVVAAPSPETGAPQPLLIFLPEVAPLLYHPSEDVRRSARGMLRHIDKADAPRAVEQLLEVLQNESRTQDHLHAIRALAAMGSQSRAATPILKQVLQRSDDQELLLASLAAIERIMSGHTSQAPSGQSLGDAMRQALSNEEFGSVAEKLDENLAAQPFHEKFRAQYNAVYPGDPNFGGGGFF
jgi:hypothetical protein